MLDNILDWGVALELSREKYGLKEDVKKLLALKAESAIGRFPFTKGIKLQSNLNN